ncbi:MAG: hypothetical protein A2V84_13850 [Chloroflexi bacterium RBG_16_70_13]|nr:MAG: hypothetical protein A2V84_13850 [Chloroflexi bacterium RBG_16_70_13]
MPTTTQLHPRPADATLTVARAAHVLGVHPNTIRAWSDAGRLRYYRINPRGDRRYRLGDLQRFLANAAEGPPPEPEASAGGHLRRGRQRDGRTALATLSGGADVFAGLGGGPVPLRSGARSPDPTAVARTWMSSPASRRSGPRSSGSRLIRTSSWARRREWSATVVASGRSRPGDFAAIG